MNKLQTAQDALRDALSAISLQKVALITIRDRLNEQIESLIDAEVKGIRAITNTRDTA